IAARSLRLILLRTGALPVLLVTVNPTPGLPSATFTACSTKPPLATFVPRAALRNCAPFFRRRNGNAGVSGTVPELRRKPTAALGTAAGQKDPAILGGHASPETVAALAHEIARLES